MAYLKYYITFDYNFSNKKRIFIYLSKWEKWVRYCDARQVQQQRKMSVKRNEVYWLLKPITCVESPPFLCTFPCPGHTVHLVEVERLGGIFSHYGREWEWKGYLGRRVCFFSLGRRHLCRFVSASSQLHFAPGRGTRNSLSASNPQRFLLLVLEAMVARWWLKMFSKWLSSKRFL